MTIPVNHYVVAGILAVVFAIRKKLYSIYESVVKFLHAHL